MMRTFETLLSLANILIFCILAIPRLGALRWMGYLTPLAVLIAGVQMLVEGPRWQMVPAYILTTIFLLIWLLGIVKLGSIHDNRFFVGVGVGLGAVTLVVSVVLTIALPIFHFPHPSGPYKIGTVTYHWVESRHEIFSSDLNAHRELMVQVWYPANGHSSSTRAPYVDDASALSPALARVLHLPGFTFDYWKHVTTNAALSVPVATNKPSYPVLIFLTGLNGFRQSNTFQIQELVSHGYIVVAIDQPYAAASVVFPDEHQITGWTRDQMQPLIDQSLSPVENAPKLNGQVLKNGIIPYFGQDVSFTLDQLTLLNRNDPNGILTGRLDLHRVGAFGVSLGAMIVAESSHRDPRIKASLMMDAAIPADVVRAGLLQPSMWITRPASTMRLERQRSGGWSEVDIAQTLSTMQAVFNKSLSGDKYYVQVPGMFHINFTDSPYWSPLLPLLGLVGPINAQRGFDIVNSYSLAFFDRYLEGGQAALLDGPSNQFSEVFFERR